MNRMIAFALIVVFTWITVPPCTIASPPPAVPEEPPITVAQRKHWSFRPLARPPIPKANHLDVSNPIDRFIMARLEAKNIAPMPQAGRITLIRRLSFGLTGLPPTTKQVDRYLKEADGDPQAAYAKLVERLLASPAYGERWAQHWLDLARFAETDGFEHDKVRKEAWRYRDWVIGAFNRDMPYDEFVRLQIAGDEIKPNKDGTHLATGFLVSGPDMPDINLVAERRHVVLNEMASTVGSVFMGLTLECAQCHNHRFDPISQADFYRFRSLFVNTLPYLKRDRQLSMTVREPGRNAPAEHFMIRGNFRRKGAEVQPAFLRIVRKKDHTIAKPNAQAKSSMRRRALAQWLTRADHPLTTRVIVNRVWMHYFGRGLSNTPSDFGYMGEKPTHPQLLDWLATELPRMNWSLKRLHRLIVTSAAYKRASRPADASWAKDVQAKAWNQWKIAKKLDPDNELLWRRNRIRLDGEAIRDAMLAAADQINPRRGGPGVRPPLPKELVATLLRNQWKVSSDKNDHRRRSIYIFARRNLRFPIFEAFDRPDGNASCSRRSKSTTAPQALILFNSAFSHRMANAVARNVRQESKEMNAQIQGCFRRILSRIPTAEERETSRRFLNKESQRSTALADLCLALMNANEFVYVD